MAGVGVAPAQADVQGQGLDGVVQMVGVGQSDLPQRSEMGLDGVGPGGVGRGEAQLRARCAVTSTACANSPRLPDHDRQRTGRRLRLEAGTHLPPLLFDDEQAVALAVAQRLVIHRAMDDASQSVLDRLCAPRCRTVHSRTDSNRRSSMIEPSLRRAIGIHR